MPNGKCPREKFSIFFVVVIRVSNEIVAGCSFTNIAINKVLNGFVCGYQIVKHEHEMAASYIYT